MLLSTSSPMALFRIGFRLLLIISCIVAITSYKIDHRPFEDRNQRAVTEWRFRRNFLFAMPYFPHNYASNNHLVDNEPVENENEDGIGMYEKQNLPNSIYDQTNK